MTYVRLILLSLALMAAVASGQSVRFQTESYSRAMRGALSESENQGFPTWVDLIAGDRGTQVHILFKVDNVDLLLIVPFDVNRQVLLEEAKKIASDVNLPKLDFIEAEGTKTRMVDIEANDYIRRNGDTSDFEWDLSRLVQAVEKCPNLPKPVTYYVRKSDAAYTKLVVGGRPSGRELEKEGFFTAKDVKPESRLIYHEKIDFVSKAQGWFLGGMMLLMLPVFPLLPWWLARANIMFAREQKRLQEAGEEPNDAVPPRSPEVVQQAFLDSVKERPKELLKVLPSLAPMLFLPLLMFRGAADRAPTPKWLEAIPLNLMLPIMFGTAGISFLISRLWVRKVLRQEGAADLPKTPAQIESEKSMWPMKFMMVPLAIMMILLIAMPFLRPYLKGVNPTLVRGLIFSPILVTFALMAWYGRKQSKANHIELKAGDQWYEDTMSFARTANTKIRGVRIQKTDIINASASLWRIVTINEGLLQKLPKDEVKAIIAHEVGHIRFQHVPKAILLSLVLQVPLFIGYFNFAEWLDTTYKINLVGFGFFANMLISAIVLPVVSWQKRKAEREADRFAMEVIGSREVVERALIAIHTLNEAPHELVKFDEVLSSHPSLKNRIAALRLANPD